MNTKRLKLAEKDFLSKYPGGFNNPEILAIGKKHKMEKLIELSQNSFKKSQFKDPIIICERAIKVVTQSSMVSMFEKPKFRDALKSASEDEIMLFAKGLKNFLHGNQEKGFEQMLSILSEKKLAKWSLITIIPAYFKPEEEVFVKPTTAKGVIDYFQLEGLIYKPRPSWDFYKAYRDSILKMKGSSKAPLGNSTAAFCGFLMMSMEKAKSA